MNIEEAEKLGIEQATKESLTTIKVKSDLNAILATVAKPIISKTGILNVPYLCKDNIVTLGTKTTAASKILENFESPYEATVVRRLREAGAVLIGKTNLDEFAMGSSTENSAYGVTKNPVDETRVPGGSSGGSAAAVASGMVPFALGSDTGGSIRQPASFCGVVGLMPTYGRVSRYGLIAMASSLDRIGPITTCVKDAARVLQIIAGYDEHDSTTVDIEVPDYVSVLDGDIKGLKIGVPKEYFGEGVNETIVQVVRLGIEMLEKQGAVVREISLPNSKYALATYYIIQPSEVSANLARYDGIRYGISAKDANNLWEVYDKSRAQGFGVEVKRRIMLGTYTLSAGFRDAYYDKAQRVRTLIKQDFDKAFEQVDVIISPTTPTVAFKIGERVQDPLSMYRADLLTAPASLAGLPAISVPGGEVEGLPVGLQIMGRQFDEKTILRVAYAYEQVR
ncbi:glutaminyl-tRNA synthase (glutamine-hydrolyzing) subunit A [candidate division Kazan bacterium RIFCSPHIGHO2_01_FULL_44_14]|uniref:Glutamyl-tRNA(Gln) amidotransferase subunit A n=1 Tax=candidate division Kazan bacterium RIFCSPLOWO2_01_FULL_45_19 TaxID=1798538 RepID=A0A1F4NPC9_UNCK3|nr:MAG: glutaminyl-tRNA synthase (glutamine-hydrolyzing) subunit A [candidate division Kazan bacterium RIFCSPLOWO2_01_FULL_45_19]OGB77556.1 MAG: glutaminyl-tRNA synthase (glutamine-hydrolyzing) subunit A [candidate division Kazan bacterium RIFCSPHIGHO2_01_FULL_44_14]